MVVQKLIHKLNPWLRQRWGGWRLVQCLCCWFFFNSQLAWAGNWPDMADTVFRHITQEQGLPHSVVTAIAQTGDGFIWVGTENGLGRWDGYRFRVYSSEATGASRLPDTSIVKLHTDSQGRLWVVLNNGTLARYDAVLDQFILRPLFDHGQVLRPQALINDQNGNLLVATNKGLLQLTDSAARLLADHALHGVSIAAIESDRRGGFWFATTQGLWWQSSLNAALQSVALPERQSMTLLKRLHDGRVVGLAEHQGLFLIEHAVARRVSLAPAQQAWFEQERFLSIAEVRPGEVWLGSFTQGIVRIKLPTGEVQRLQHDFGFQTSLIGDAVHELFVDRTGLLWVGTQRGLSLHDLTQVAVLSIFSKPGLANQIGGTDVRSILAPSPDRVFLGLSGQGVNLLDPERHTVTPIVPVLNKRMVQGISQVPNGDIYFAAESGLVRTNSLGEQAYEVPMADHAPRMQTGVAEYYGTRLWVGSVNGLWQLDPTLAQPTLIRAPGSDALNEATIRSMAWDGKSSLWIGTNSVGLFHYDMARQRLTPIPLQQMGGHFSFIAALLVDPKGRLWVGGQGDGVLVLPSASRTDLVGSKAIGKGQGLPNLMINRFVIDDQGKVWASTDGGLAQIDPELMQAKPLLRAEGVNIDTYWAGSGNKTVGGDILFGGAGGVTVVRPNLMQATYRFPTVLPTHVQLGGSEVWPGSGLTIHPRANSMTLEFAALDYAAPERIQYAYRLDGYDNDWINTPVTRRLASYTNLPPGEYRLQLRASNRYGQWNEKSFTLPITVLPHWWQTWWTRLGFALVALFLLVALVQVRTGWLRRRQLELEQQVAERTTELHQKQQELLESNQSLNQSNIDLAKSMAYLRDAQAKIVHQEKLASIGTLTAGISHEINNPSNFAHVGAYNLGTDLAELREFLLQLAGDDATPDLVQALDARFAKLHQSLDAVSEGTTRIRDLVHDLRTFSRLGETDWVVASLADSLHATVHLVRTQYAEDIDMRLDLPVNPELLCWPAQLNQVFMNIIVNACQAMMARPPGLRASEPGVLQISNQIEADFLLISFRDNGPGIAPEVLQRIFDPFFTTKTVGEGMGMGLSISHGIIEKHQGSISVQSEVGVGTCFTLHLPLMKGA